MHFFSWRVQTGCRFVAANLYAKSVSSAPGSLALRNA
jgi:hypothetical protein